MHDCGKLREQIWEAVEAGGVSRELQSEISGCESCRRELARAESAMQGFEVMRTEGAPDCASAVMARIDRAASRGRWAWAYALGLVLVVGVLAVMAAMRWSGGTGPANITKDVNHKPAVPVARGPESVGGPDVVRRDPDVKRTGERRMLAHRPERPVRRRKAGRVKTLSPVERGGSCLQAAAHVEKRPGGVKPSLEQADAKERIMIVVTNDYSGVEDKPVESLNYTYTLTNADTGDVTECSMKRSGDVVELRMNVEPGRKESPGQGSLDHENNISA